MVFVLPAFLVIFYLRSETNRSNDSGEVGLFHGSHDSTRLGVREAARKDKFDAVEVIEPPELAEGYFINRISELESDQAMGGRQKAERISGVLYEWALSSPDEAVEYMKSTFGSEVYAYELFVPAVLTSWSKHDPREALNYIVSNPDSIPFSLDMVKRALESAVEHDGSMLLKYVGDIPADWVSYLCRDLKEFFSENGQDSILIDRASRLPPGSDQKRAFLMGLSDAYAVDDDWGFGWEVVGKLDHMGHGEEVSTQIRETFSRTASWSDPVGFMQWADNGDLDARTKDLFIQAAAADWARRDIVAYSGWVGGLPLGQRNDDLISNIIEPTFHDDPVSALQWASLIRDPDIKDAYYSKIMDATELERHSEEIDRLIGQGVLPAELKKKGFR